MDWSREAEAAIKKVPFFIRKRVRARVEDEAQKADREKISLSDVRLTQKRFLTRMSDEVQGYQLETCFGSSGCPNRAVDSGEILQRIEKTLKKAEIRKFLQERVEGQLRHHHDFRVVLADCPNACSQPQIRDMGIIGASELEVTAEACTLCRACVDVCKENAVLLEQPDVPPLIDLEKCLKCGKCTEACPTGTLVTKRKAYRIQLGGKLGRHPRLAEELPDLHSENEVIDILNRCLAYYKNRSRKGERFAEIYEGYEGLKLEPKKSDEGG